MDTHRRRSSHNSQNAANNSNVANSASMVDNDSFEVTANDIYSGVDLVSVL
jgi:hypothetical protein